MTNGFKIQTINVTVRKNQYNLIFCKKKNPVWLCETIQSIRLEPLRNFWKMHTRPTCYTKGSLHNACDDVIICTCTSSKPGILLQLHRPSTSQWLECLEFVEILKLTLRHRYVCISRKFSISHNLSPTLVSFMYLGQK